MDSAAIQTTAAARPGKSAQSVGHQAKAAVAEAKAAGIDLPKNAQGMAASAIAQGAEPGSVFAALAVAEPTETTDTGAATPEEPPLQEVPSEAEAGYAQAADVVGDAALAGADTALALLEGSAPV